MHIPAEVAGAAIDAVAAAEDPEPRAGFVLDLEIVTHRLGFVPVLPPFAIDALGPVGLADDMGVAAPGEPARRAVGKQSHHLVDRLGRAEQPHRARPLLWPAALQ